MEIMGDPDLIKQDGVFYIVTKQDADTLGIPTESHERFVRVSFQSPIDVNTTTGLPEGLRDTETIFNGHYRISKVKSNFKKRKKLGKKPKNLPLISLTLTSER